GCSPPRARSGPSTCRPCRCATLANPTVSVRVQRPTSSVVLDGLLRIRSERLPGVAGERDVPLVVHRIAFERILKAHLRERYEVTGRCGGSTCRLRRYV